MKRNFSCLCGANVRLDYSEEIDIDENNGYFDEIQNGTFMSVSCSSCGKKHKPELKIIVIWKSKNLKMEVIPELERGEFYRRKKHNQSVQTIISFPEMADRLAVIKDNLEPVVIETLKSFLLTKAAENYPENDINAWYCCCSQEGIEFHLDGIRQGEIAVMKIPQELYNKTRDDYRKHPKKDIYTSLRVGSYLSVQNLFRSEAFR
ncbi:MAG: CpXC domain-containing protein [Treponema sp.]|nr:CpXC domain-containing protein [Treponema sp.]